jgi:hypothetical protein
MSRPGGMLLLFLGDYPFKCGLPIADFGIDRRPGQKGSLPTLSKNPAFLLREKKMIEYIPI